jgi:hypothetical protein
VVQMTGINMVVGIDGQPGKSMIQEARGLQVKVQRPLRDVFKKVPEVMVDVQVNYPSMLSGCGNWNILLRTTGVLKGYVHGARGCNHCPLCRPLYTLG